MESHLELNDDLFEEEFAACTLDPKIFSHEAHMRLAWIHIKKYGVDRAVENICIQLVAYVEHLGSRNKFNKTLTVAAIYAVNHFINRSHTNTFKDLIEEFPRLKFNFKDLMAAHYGIDIYTSPAAKENFMQPDLLPFS